MNQESVIFNPKLSRIAYIITFNCQRKVVINMKEHKGVGIILYMPSNNPFFSELLKKNIWTQIFQVWRWFDRAAFVIWLLSCFHITLIHDQKIKKQTLVMSLNHQMFGANAEKMMPKISWDFQQISDEYLSDISSIACVDKWTNESCNWINLCEAELQVCLLELRGVALWVLRNQKNTRLPQFL